MRPQLTLLAGAFLATAAGCPEPRSTLRPAPQAHRVGESIAVERVADISVETTAGAWPGNSEVLRYTEPLQVHLRNDSESPVRIEYHLFDLVDESGRSYAALPPLQVEERRAARNFDPRNVLLDPMLVAQGYQVHPSYEPLYDDVLPYLDTNRYGLGYSIDHEDTDWSYWRERDVLPTSEMRDRAIPQGVLLPAGEVEGFFYFEKIPGGAGPVALRVRFVHAETGAEIAQVSIPFVAR